MDELDKGLAVAAPQPVRADALRRCRTQLRAWDISVPDVDPLVLDFGLGDFESVGLIEFWIANEMEAGYCAKYLFVFDGQTCPMHYHREKHETYFVVRGNLEVHCDDNAYRLSPGGTLPIAPPRPHSFTGAGPALLLEISTPCVIDDNYFRNARIPIGGNYRPHD